MHSIYVTNQQIPHDEIIPMNPELCIYLKHDCTINLQLMFFTY